MNYCIAGCGYIGEQVARLLREKGCGVRCLVRTSERRERLAGDGFEAVACNFDDPAGIPPIDCSGRTLFYFVPPPGGGIHDTRARNFCSAMGNAAPPARIVYMSATSVYSEISGGVVTESSPAEPASAMGKRRLDAERIFREYASANGSDLVILRVSGIYGPGRLPLMQLSQGHPLLREEESGPSNRIHAEDLSAICVAAAERGRDGEIFNVSDGHPSSMTAYFNACADALGFPRPPQVTLEEARLVMSPLMLSYVSESRIVDNRHILERLGVALRYPSLESGVPASVKKASD